MGFVPAMKHAGIFRQHTGGSRETSNVRSEADSTCIKFLLLKLLRLSELPLSTRSLVDTFPS